MMRSELRDRLDEIISSLLEGKKPKKFKPEAKEKLLALANETFSSHELYEILFTFAWPDDATGVLVTDWMRDIVNYHPRAKTQ